VYDTAQIIAPWADNRTQSVKLARQRGFIGGREFEAVIYQRIARDGKGVMSSVRQMKK
jgi:hypothetical protein